MVKVGLEQKSEYEVSKNIVLFPNPNNGSFELINIDSSLFGNKPIQLNVYDLNGRNLFSKNLSDSDIPNCQVNLQQFMDGMYIVKLNSETYSQDFKFIKN
jgi:Secretion system C-terminal sorting domain